MEDIFFDTNFRIITKLAEGGMGSIYLAEWQGPVGFRKIVALKMVRKDISRQRDTKVMFLGEAKLVADLIHENILQIYMLGQTEDGYFMVMEAVFGKNLDKFIAKHKERNRTVEPEIGAFVISRVCRGLDYAHNKTDWHGKALDIVHRDVTPSNVMINYGGVVKLTDFGIAKAMSHHTPDEKTTVMGKYPYLSPEQVMFQGTDRRSDIFSLGLVAFELLTGKMVYKVTDIDSLIDKMERFRIPDLCKVNSSVPRALGDIVMKAVQLDPAARFQTAREMGQALEHFMYDKGYGPTNEKLAAYMAELFPEEEKNARW
jgi:serine/threonine protein kinase